MCKLYLQTTDSIKDSTLSADSTTITTTLSDPSVSNVPEVIILIIIIIYVIL